MPLITLILVLVVVGVAMYLVNVYVPMDSKIKTILNWVVVIVVILWVLNIFGIWSYLNLVSVPRAR